MSDELRPKMMRIGAMQWEMLRKVSREIGPRHRNADRWLYDLGWTFAPGVLEKSVNGNASDVTSGKPAH